MCADGPLLAGELATGAARQVVEEWLLGRGWRSDTMGGTAGDGVVLCPRCAPVAPVPSAAADSPVTVSDPASGRDDAGGDSEWTLW